MVVPVPLVEEGDAVGDDLQLGRRAPSFGRPLRPQAVHTSSRIALTRCGLGPKESALSARTRIRFSAPAPELVSPSAGPRPSGENRSSCDITEPDVEVLGGSEG